VQRIDHLQRAILTNQFFRLAPQRLYVLHPISTERGERSITASVAPLIKLLPSQSQQ
jgi:hypothetical protein